MKKVILYILLVFIAGFSLYKAIVILNSFKVQSVSYSNDVKDFGEVVIVVPDHPEGYERPLENQLVKKQIESKLLEDRHIKVDLQPKVLPNGIPYMEKLNVMISANEEMDAFSAWYDTSRWFLKYWSQRGLVTELDDLLKTNGRNLQMKIPKMNWSTVTYRKKVMGIPAVINEQETAAFIRKDWLHRIERDIPTTLEELEYVLEKFRSMGKTPVVATPWDLRRYLFSVYGIPLIDFKDPDTGKIMNYVFHPHFKEYLFVMRRWYTKEYILKNYHSISDEQVSELYKLGRGGVIICHAGDFAHVYNQLRYKNQNAEAEFLPIVSDKGLEPGLSCENSTKSVLSIMKNSTKAEAVVEYFDWMIDDYRNSIMASNGIENVHYRYLNNGNTTDIVRYSDPAVNGYNGLYNFYGVNWGLFLKYDNSPNATPTQKAYSNMLSHPNKIYSESEWSLVEMGDASEREWTKFSQQIKLLESNFILGRIDIQTYDQEIEKLKTSWAPISDELTAKLSR